MSFHNILFQPEGIQEEYSIPVLIDLRNDMNFEEQLVIVLPEDVVNGSVSIRVSVIGMYAE